MKIKAEHVERIEVNISAEALREAAIDYILEKNKLNTHKYYGKRAARYRIHDNKLMSKLIDKGNVTMSVSWCKEYEMRTATKKDIDTVNAIKLIQKLIK